MSDSRSFTNTSTQVENEINNSKKHENREGSVRILDLTDEKETEGEISCAERKSFTFIDMENTIEPPGDKIDELTIDVGKFVDLTGLKINVISPRAPRRILTIMGLYDTIFGRRQQEQQGHFRPRYTNQIWRQEPPPQQPQQTIWTQYGPGQGQQRGYSGYGGDGAYGYDGGGPLIYDPRSRNSFVALVMGIVFVMLVATAGFLGVVLATPELKEFFQRVAWMIVLPAMLGLMIVNCAMICSPCARRAPCNIICLILTFDFTSYLLYIVAIATAFSVIVMIILISMMVTGNAMKPMLLVILIIGTLIQIVMLTMQLQMILGGRTIEISEADYALADFLIYTSILDIFLKLVHIMGLFDH